MDESRRVTPPYSVAAAIVPSDGTFEAAAVALLGADEKALCATIRHAGRRRQWLAGRLLGKRVLDGATAAGDDLVCLDPAELLGTRSDWQIGRAPDGAAVPIRDGQRSFLSLSHSGGLAFAAASSRCRVGVDVEEVASPIRELISSPSEVAWIASLPARDRAGGPGTVLATLLWSVKEALLKTGAFGPVSPGRAMSLVVEPDAPASAVADAWTAAPGWRTLPLRLPAFATALNLAWRPIGRRHVGVVAHLPCPPEPDGLLHRKINQQESRGIPRMVANASIAAVRQTAPVLDRVKRVFVDVVRYPASAFDGIDDDLENDLGIDSVKLGEVLVALRAEFRLGHDDILPDHVAREGARSLAGLAGTIEDALRGRAPDPADIAPPPLAVSTPHPPLTSRAPAADAVQMRGATPQPASNRAAITPASTQPAGPHALAADLLATVTRAFADVTRYPMDILQPDADLEDDLGIDSVKFGEIMNTLRDRLRVPAAEDWPTAFPRTIGDVARLMMPLQARDPGPARPAPGSEGVPTSKSAPGPKTVPATPRPATQRFDGKVALVTGSGHGVGRTHALRLAALGAEVIVNSFHSRQAGDDATAEIRASGGKAHHVWGSVANPAHITRMYAEVEACSGGLDFLVNTASHSVVKPFEDITAEDLLKLYATNVVAVQLGSLAAAKLMAKRGGGRIVNLSATASRHIGHLYAAMAPVNAAVETLTRYLAVELMAANVQVNCLVVGVGARDLSARWPDRSARLPRWEATLPGEQPCSAADIAEMVVFLLDAQTRQLNGSIITMDGASSIALAGAAR